MSDASASAPVITRRYARSRLYDAARGQHISLETPRLWLARGMAFAVLDAEDVTHVLLA